MGSINNMNVDKELKDYDPVPVVHELRYSILKRIRAGEDVLPDIQGREETKKDIIRAILSGANLYLVSEEGTGKTRLARSLTALLTPLIKIRDCPYNDDPRWPLELLCPRCRQAGDPLKKYGIEVIPGRQRFSRIQGNEYTNEAKLLGLKDIQAIAQGKCPTDPTVFTGTGVFNANRGILFVDELPAIRTNVQVLLHPLLEEKQVILEEYNYQYPLDLFMIATGNPSGFSHVYDVPRPLLDRMELIYMDLPEEDVEREIILRERFRIQGDGFNNRELEEVIIPYSEMKNGMQRTVATPWWIVDIVNKAVRYSRICPKLERAASIRASNRALDHTCASAELECRDIVNLEDVFFGLRLALRGRIGLNPEHLDIDNPRVSFRRTDRLAEDFEWNAIENFEPALFEGCNGEKLVAEIKSIFPCCKEETSYRIAESDEIRMLVNRIKMAGQISDGLLNETEKMLVHSPEKLSDKTLQEYDYSVLELVANLAVHRRLVSESVVRQAFVPRKVTDLGVW